MEDLYIGVVGIHPDDFWNNTWKENALLAESKQNRYLDDLDMARTMAYHIYRSQVGAMDGKQVFKSIKQPKDIMQLPQDNLHLRVNKKKETAVFDPDRAIAAYNSTEKDKAKWLQKN